MREAAHHRPSRLRRLAALALPAACACLALTAAADAAPAGSWLIQTNARLIRVGDWRVDQAPYLGEAVRAYGRPARCLPLTWATGSTVRWSSVGLRLVTLSYGALPEGETSCSYARMPVSHIIVTGRRWTTSLGLRVGDSVARLRMLYPQARYQARSRGEAEPGNAYVLVTRRTFCLGDCGAVRYVTVARLAAKVRAGRVVELVLPVGAQGE